MSNESLNYRLRLNLENPEMDEYRSPIGLVRSFDPVLASGSSMNTFVCKGSSADRLTKRRPSSERRTDSTQTFYPL
jgi:hypothetical protein